MDIFAVEIFKYLRPSYSQHLYVHRSRYAGTQQQLNTSDCGMFMLGHAEAIVMGEPIAFTQIDIPVLRKRIVLALTRDFAATFSAVPLAVAVPAAASTKELAASKKHKAVVSNPHWPALFLFLSLLCLSLSLSLSLSLRRLNCSDILLNLSVYIKFKHWNVGAAPEQIFGSGKKR